MTAVAEIDHAASALLDVQVWDDRGVLTVAVGGELDLLTAPELARVVEVHLAARPRCIELDLRRVSYFGATGMAALLDVRDAVRHAGAQLRLLAGPAVAGRLGRLRLDGVVTRV